MFQEHEVDYETVTKQEPEEPETGEEEKEGEAAVEPEDSADRSKPLVSRY